MSKKLNVNKQFQKIQPISNTKTIREIKNEKDNF